MDVDRLPFSWKHDHHWPSLTSYGQVLMDLEHRGGESCGSREGSIFMVQKPIADAESLALQQAMLVVKQPGIFNWHFGSFFSLEDPSKHLGISLAMVSPISTSCGTLLRLVMLSSEMFPVHGNWSFTSGEWFRVRLLLHSQVKSWPDDLPILAGSMSIIAERPTWKLNITIYNSQSIYTWRNFHADEGLRELVLLGIGGPGERTDLSVTVLNILIA